VAIAATLDAFTRSAPLDHVRRILRGLPNQAWSVVASLVCLGKHELAETLRLNPRTLQRRSTLRREVVIGFSLISHGTNLLLLTTGKLKRGVVPILVEGYQGMYTDPLPQALVLTAIVIGFGVLAFTLVLVKRVYQTVGTDDMDEMRKTDGF
jgi:multicomponent Na+:H+ antiporter subunit C